MVTNEMQLRATMTEAQERAWLQREAQRDKAQSNIIQVAFFVLLALLSLYAGGGGYGRYTADAYDWMETR
jgi:hypothetical protein